MAHTVILKDLLICRRHRQHRSDSRSYDRSWLPEGKTDRKRLVDAVEMIRSIAGHAPFAGMIGSELTPGGSVSDRASIKAALSGALTTYQHPMSTVPMGGPRGGTALVDSAGRVRCVAGLRVVDASIWPDVPSVATGFPTVMLAEKIAAGMV